MRDGTTKWSRSFNGRVPPTEVLFVNKNEKPLPPPYFEAAP